LGYRQTVINNKLPRRVELQDEVAVRSNDVEYVKFEESFEGVIKSHIEHHRDSFEDVYPIWREYRDYYRLKK
jgi:hypothetical protein